MTLGNIMDIAISGLTAERTRMTITAANIANAKTTRTANGDPYRRRDPVFVSDPIGGPFSRAFEGAMRGVRVSRVVEDRRDFITQHEPGHPDADKFGMVRYPRVNVVEEMSNLLSASRSFEANLMVIHKVRNMSQAVLKIGS